MLIAEVEREVLIFISNRKVNAIFKYIEIYEINKFHDYSFMLYHPSICEFFFKANSK